MLFYFPILLLLLIEMRNHGYLVAHGVATLVSRSHILQSNNHLALQYITGASELPIAICTKLGLYHFRILYHISIV